VVTLSQLSFMPSFLSRLWTCSFNQLVHSSTMPGSHDWHIRQKCQKACTVRGVKQITLTLSMNCLSGNCLYSRTLLRCLLCYSHCIHMTCVLDHSTYQIILTIHTHHLSVCPVQTSCGNTTVSLDLVSKTLVILIHKSNIKKMHILKCLHAL
jgi:hypothetical protein